MEYKVVHTGVISSKCSEHRGDLYGDQGYGDHVKTSHTMAQLVGSRFVEFIVILIHIHC